MKLLDHSPSPSAEVNEWGYTSLPNTSLWRDAQLNTGDIS